MPGPEGDTRTSHTQLVSLRVPLELWDDICTNADKAGRTRTAEMLGRLERGKKAIKDEWSKAGRDKPVEPKKFVGTRKRVAERTVAEVAEIVETIEQPCTHPGERTFSYGTFCASCGTRLR